MITITDAKLVYDQIRRHPIGTSFELDLIGFAGGAVGTLRMVRATELDRWTYIGPLKIPRSTHAKELQLYRPSTPNGLSALARCVRQELRGEARSVVLRNPRSIDSEAIFDSQIVFETSFYTVCRLRHSGTLQLHAGPYRLDVEPHHITALTNPDREARKSALVTILDHNSEPRLHADEILRAGGSTETYNLDQLCLAAGAAPVNFDEEEDRYLET